LLRQQLEVKKLLITVYSGHLTAFGAALAKLQPVLKPQRRVVGDHVGIVVRA